MSNLKKVYYVVLTYLYSFCGWMGADQIATNSSWTNNHILQLWMRPKCTKIVYPPVDTDDLIAKTGDLSKIRDNLMISFAQFRPEKDHALQLRVWASVLPTLPSDAKFYLIGSVRDEDDKRIVEALKDLAKRLGIDQSVEFKINLPRYELHDIFARAKVAVHTMRNEHFGIAVVELMASGILTIAHNSAGPKEDIIGGTELPVGYLAETEEEYARFVKEAMLRFEQKR